MLITVLFLLLFSSALTMRKESTVYFSRVIIVALSLTSYICYNNTYPISLETGIGLYGGLFNVTTITQCFSIFILLITATILVYNSFYHRILTKDNENNILEVSYWTNELKRVLSLIFLNNRAGGENKTLPSSINNTTSSMTYFKGMPLKNLNPGYNTIYDRTILNQELDTIKTKGTQPHLALKNAAPIYRIIEYPLIILFIICGGLFLMSAGDLISIFISIELQSYGLYILSSLHRDSEQSTWGGLTYFLLGGLSSCFILLGSALLYINSGTTSLDGLYIISTISDIGTNLEIKQIEETLYENIGGLSLPLTENSVVGHAFNFTAFDYYYINISLIFIFVGFLFKVSAAPFHFWSPDVYDSLPTTVTTYVAIIAKISIFIFLLELVYYLNGDLYLGNVSGNYGILYTSSWKNCILISSVLSLIIGSILGLTQFRIKKVYAYSTINHVGFILLALCVNNTESIQAYIFYIISYSISNLNAFIILVTIGYTLYLYTETVPFNKGSLSNQNKHVLLKDRGSDFKNSPIQLVSQLKGYFYINSYLALSLAITLFSFMGIPPLIGFFAKQMVLSAALDNGYVFITLIGILTSVIGAVYYLNIVKQMFFFNSDYVINPYINKYNFFGIYKDVSASNKDTVLDNNNLKISSGLSSVISLLTLTLLLFIFIPNESLNLAKLLSVLLFN